MDVSRFLDNPAFVEAAFHARHAERGTSSVENAVDGTVAVGDGVELGWRYFPAVPQPSGSADGAAAEGGVDAPVPCVVAWHGNAELAAEYDALAPLWTGARGEPGFPRAHLIVLDFAGYGWSTGGPLISTLGKHGAAMGEKLPSVLKEAGVPPSAPVFGLGRSIGSVAAVNMVHATPKTFKGLVLDAGIGSLFTLPIALSVLGSIPLATTLLKSGVIGDPFDNSAKLSSLHTPLLVMHGDTDHIVPHTQGEANFASSAAAPEHKRLRLWKGAGHNDTLHLYGREVFGEITDFLATYSAPDSAPPAPVAAKYPWDGWFASSSSSLSNPGAAAAPEAAAQPGSGGACSQCAIQ